MSERKYTDEEIVKALECCQYRECQECIRLHTGRPIEDDCRLDLIYDSLALIKRQKADVDKLQEVNADLNESLRLAAEANKDLKAEVEEWEARAKERQGRVKKYLAEIEQMEQESNFLAKRFYKEGVKDLAERLKANMCHGYPYLEIEEDLFRRDVDNLVAEKTEGE